MTKKQAEKVRKSSKKAFKELFFQGTKKGYLKIGAFLRKWKI